MEIKVDGLKISHVLPAGVQIRCIRSRGLMATVSRECICVSNETSSPKPAHAIEPDGYAYDFHLEPGVLQVFSTRPVR